MSKKHSKSSKSFSKSKSGKAAAQEELFHTPERGEVAVYKSGKNEYYDIYSSDGSGRVVMQISKKEGIEISEEQIRTLEKGVAFVGSGDRKGACVKSDNNIPGHIIVKSASRKNCTRLICKETEEEGIYKPIKEVNHNKGDNFRKKGNKGYIASRA